MFSSPRPSKASQLVSCLPAVLANRRQGASISAVQCESSGYESIVRDSECSSFGSSQDSDPGEPHDPGGSKKGANYNLDQLHVTLHFKIFHNMRLGKHLRAEMWSLFCPTM
jgi:hypothetical protein